MIQVEIQHVCADCGTTLVTKDIRDIRQTGVDGFTTVIRTMVEACSGCKRERNILIASLFEALPWEKQEEFTKNVGINYAGVAV